MKAFVTGLLIAITVAFSLIGLAHTIVLYSDPVYRAAVETVAKRALCR